jgi:hypothetical protein
MSERNNVTSLRVDEGGSARSLILGADVSLSRWRPSKYAQRYADVKPNSFVAQPAPLRYIQSVMTFLVSLLASLFHVAQYAIPNC